MMPLLSLHRRNILSTCLIPTFVQNQILVFHFQTDNNNNLLLTEREGRTGEYWPEVCDSTDQAQQGPYENDEK